VPILFRFVRSPLIEISLFFLVNAPPIGIPICMFAITSGLAAVVAGGGVSPFVAAALKPAMGTLPQWTLALHFVTLSMLLRTRPFAGVLPAILSTSVMSLSSVQGHFANVCRRVFTEWRGSAW